MKKPSEQNTPTQGKSVFSLIVPAVFLVVLVANLTTGAGPAGDNLDLSWTSVLAWATMTHARFGTDIVFTYGPLGFFVPYAAYMPDAYPWFLAGTIALAIIVAAPVAALTRYTNRTYSIVILILCALWSPWLTADPSWLLYFAASSALVIASNQSTAPGRVLQPLLLGFGGAFIALVKFSMFPLSLVWVAMMSLALASLQRKHQALVFTGSYLGSLVTLWVLSGQQPADIVPFIQNAFEVARGYSGAMGITPPTRVTILGLTLLATTGLWLTIQLIKHIRTPGVPYALFVLGCTLFIAWKAGFTRADGHTNMTMPLFSLVLLSANAVLQPVRDQAASAPWRGIMAAAVLALCVMQPSARLSNWGNYLVAKQTIVRDLFQYRSLLARKQAEWKRDSENHALPVTSSQAGSEPMDLVSYGQGVLFLNGFNYRPRPVFQSYSAYTPKLLEMNRQQLDRTDAPRWLMLHLSTIDGRLPSLDDGVYLTQLFANHEAVTEEGGFLLFKRSSTAPAQTAWPVSSHTASMEEWISVPPPEKGMFTTATLDIDLGVKGKLYQLLLRGPGLIIEAETASGTIERYRLIPEMAKTPFILSPLPRSNMEVVDTLTGTSSGRLIKRFRIVHETKIDLFFVKPVFRYGFSRSPYHPASPSQRSELIGIRSAGFSHIPSSMSGGAELKNERGMLVMGAHAPSAFTFQLPAGKYALHGQFGILRDALTLPLCLASGSDGIEIEVSLPERGNTVLLRKSINPFKAASDRGPQPFSIDEIHLAAPSSVAIRIKEGPEGSTNNACDWSYLQGVRFTALP